MQIREFFSIVILLSLFFGAYAQIKEPIDLFGYVLDADRKAIAGASIRLLSAKKSTFTDENGCFRLADIRAGQDRISVSTPGYKTYLQELSLSSSPLILTILLERDAVLLNEVHVDERITAGDVKRSAYAVDAIDLNALQGQNLDMNRLLDRMAGVRVRESGGLGSDVSYTINGLTGKAVKFFIDGIPMQSFGAAFGLGNFPVNTLARIEVYKGALPVELGSDALGGAVNLVTRREMNDYLDLSYSLGSFDTHRAAVSGGMQNATSGLTMHVNASYNYSANNYRVWGQGVAVAGADGRPIDGLRFRRFNDDYNSKAAQLEVGFRKKVWADKLLVGLNASEMDRGIQTGRTMAFVYGQVRYDDYFLMPNLTYAKHKLLNGKLDLDFFIGHSWLKGTTTDTGSVKYNWAGEVVAHNVQGELNGIRAQKSIYSFRDGNTHLRLLAGYRLTDAIRLRLAFNGNELNRKGSDALGLAEWTIPLREPQMMRKGISALAIETNTSEGHLQHTLSLKNFAYKTQANTYDYNGSDKKELILSEQRDHFWGAGYALRWLAQGDWLAKFSAEKSYRLPETVELLGDGNTILNAPNLQPENSLNFNLSAQKVFHLTPTFRVEAYTGLFYRDTKDLIWLGEGDLFGTARYENLSNIRSQGVEVELRMSHHDWLMLNLNATYQDVRNKQQFTISGAPNIVYNDRLRNMPYWLANGELRLRKVHGKFLRHASCYVSTHYVNAYYVGWPSLGAREGKATIPTQFVQDIGVSYLLQSIPLTISADCYNVLDRQVYDNYLLQKPGRFLSVKLVYQIIKK